MSGKTLLFGVTALATALAGEATANTTAHLHHGSLPHISNEIDEKDPPLLVEVAYTGEAMANVSGGASRGTEYLDNLDVVLEADMERLIGLPATQLHVYGLYNNGASISAHVGDSFATSNIEADSRHRFRLYEAWVQHQITPSLSLKAGLYDLNSEFDALETSGLFVGSAHGIGVDISQTGQNGPSIFPVTSLAVRVEKQLTSGVKLRAAVLDGVPGNPDRPGRTTIRFNRGDGLLTIGEVELPLEEGRVLLGHWRYTGRFDRFSGGMARGNAGTYLRGEKRISKWQDTRVDAFARLGTAPGKFNMFDRFVSAGLKVTGVFDSPSDEAGVAIASARTSRHYRDTTFADKTETVVELSYRREVLSFLSVQPSLQVVFNPGADPGLRTAIVPGIRTELSFQF
ncbi:carbohydrate porin [Sphingobium subterraneum]|uniref:Porin n=1 Tax=Sphingobium subterraneum TaxID=627688 RepID=A0A841J674_9SPHN|nr:carbohydrate porin [Sphingobium subterraneum]MBB6124028.1 porin [Sphingobium subterraneum]